MMLHICCFSCVQVAKSTGPICLSYIFCMLRSSILSQFERIKLNYHLINSCVYDFSFAYGYFHSDPHQSSGQILASKFSPSGSLFAVCDDYKQLTVWENKTGWETVSTR